MDAYADSGTFYPTNAGGEDDCDVGAVMDATGDDIYMGKGGAQTLDIGVRFRSVTIPKGSTISAAYVRFTAYDSHSTNNVDVVMSADDTATPGAFVDKAGFEARNRTTANTAQNNLPAWTDGTQYNMDDIASAVEEVVALAGWASGNNLAILIDEAGTSSDSHYRCASSLEFDGGSEKPELHVTWTPPAGGSQLIIVEED